MARADVGLARSEYDAARQDARDAIGVCEEAGLAAQHARASRALHAIDTAVASLSWVTALARAGAAGSCWSQR